MPDEIDQQQECDKVYDDVRLREIRRRAAAIPEGNQGVCEWCDNESPRLVGGACARCRDENGLP